MVWAFVLGILSTHAWLDHRKKTSLPLSLSLSLLFIVELIKLSHRISPHSYHGFLFPWVERACLQNDQAVRN
jgi:hypothetical protein